MLDARRRAGDTLIEMKERGELDCGKGGDRKSRSQPGRVKLADLGLTFNQSSRYQLEARVQEKQVVEGRCLRPLRWRQNPPHLSHVAA